MTGVQTCALPIWVKKDCGVTLKLYSLLGEEIAIVTDQHYKAGTHKVVVNAKGLSSGMYLYKIEMGGYSAVRKMLVLK